ncbi:OLC1v1026868C2 [Oldenlandia corymbosa var. corymbosa]|nr:OLC1v1026868C2 [Oldenlandia corymbosa var. corymbosa]
MKNTLPPQLLKVKLPRFLQKCAQTFQTDRRYSNDLRYLRVWLQLMDFVDDPKSALRTMETNRIGLKKSLFYQAYALYFEKMKKFEAAEKMYHLGVQNLAEPLDELQKSYEQFLQRKEQYKNKKNRYHGGKTGNLQPSFEVCQDSGGGSKENECSKPTRTWQEESLLGMNGCNVNMETLKSSLKNSGAGVVPQICSKETKQESNKITNHDNEDTVLGKFLDKAIVGKSDAEDARHHGLVEPTINTKEVMDAINSMFREPLEPSHRDQSKTEKSLNSGLGILNDGKLEAKDVLLCQKSRKNSTTQADRSTNRHPLQEPLQIYIDDEENRHTMEMVDAKVNLDDDNDQNRIGDGKVCGENFKGFVFPHPLDVPLNSSKSNDVAKPCHLPIREDTAVYRFVGSTISSEPEVENVCHHGLVEPTINLKEAMDDINSMFGKPIEFVRQTRSKRKEEANHNMSSPSAFLILPDDKLAQEHEKSFPHASTKNENDLFEQTVCTREAMDEINKMFGMPLDF